MISFGISADAYTGQSNHLIVKRHSNPSFTLKLIPHYTKKNSPGKLSKNVYGKIDDCTSLPESDISFRIQTVVQCPT